MRFTSDGQLDFSFGDNGLVQTALGGTTHDLASIAIAPDGSIYAAGSGGDGRVELVRYTDKGRLDTTFGTGGVATQFFPANYPYGSSASAATVLVGPDLKPIVFGTLCAVVEGQTQFCNFLLTRFSSVGQVESTGLLTSAYWSQRDQYLGRAATLQADGKLLVAGTRSGDVVMERFYPPSTTGTGAGGFDQTFGSGGIVVDGSFPTDLAVNSVVADPRGTIWVAGEGWGPDPYDSYTGDRGWLVRYSSAGVLDSSFGTNGQATIPSADHRDASPIRAIVLQPNGQVVAAGDGKRVQNLDESTVKVVDGFLLARFGKPLLRSIVGPFLKSSAKVNWGNTLQPVGNAIKAAHGAIWKILP